MNRTILSTTWSGGRFQYFTAVLSAACNTFRSLIRTNQSFLLFALALGMFVCWGRGYQSPQQWGVVSKGVVVLFYVPGHQRPPFYHDTNMYAFHDLGEVGVKHDLGRGS